MTEANGAGAAGAAAVRQLPRAPGACALRPPAPAPPRAPARWPAPLAPAVDVRGCDYSGRDLSSKVLSGVLMQARRRGPHGGQAAAAAPLGCSAGGCSQRWTGRRACSASHAALAAHRRRPTSPARGWWASSLRARRRRARRSRAPTSPTPTASPPLLMAPTWRWVRAVLERAALNEGKGRRSGQAAAAGMACLRCRLGRELQCAGSCRTALCSTRAKGGGDGVRCCVGRAAMRRLAQGHPPGAERCRFPACPTRHAPPQGAQFENAILSNATFGQWQGKVCVCAGVGMSAGEQRRTRGERRAPSAGQPRPPGPRDPPPSPRTRAVGQPEGRSL